MIGEKKIYTAADFWNSPEGELFEVMHGEKYPYAMPPPNIEHQRIVLALTLALTQQLGNKHWGEVFVSPVGVELPSGHSVIPDLVLLANANMKLAQKNGIVGVPDVLIEVLSPGNAYNDTKVKFKLYEQAGVPEYFIVDPADKEVTAYALVNGQYQQVYKAIGAFESKLMGLKFSF